ncbi:hypothetical protein Kpol_1041p6 [Vanderwaltozyma polyspora DSM 70294]|uniref:Uncharacterized protein n=1 Tax=Vanderwaltozyma polyspora (strain ATCC 22028 / DSM 70294 / BCRC 21397 / CBS 2163 / NBRC 10782 / NRRL Y-8283 / UCD 57-17) TaxID=436907 RepID=A7TL73_VANPO|nr:uncharacterized protein Kpol_1041p6 [Vanderwaltozyma polyspora DSM 70294]EDO16948.1 hypothetical protein Kpol_1041p6 [Vanderwaltozyma polyspora DSM 70294]
MLTSDEIPSTDEELTTPEYLVSSRSGELYYIFTQTYEFVNSETDFTEGFVTTKSINRKEAATYKFSATTITTDASYYKHLTNEKNYHHKSNSDPGTIAGSVVGSIAGFMICIFLVWFLVLRKRNKKSDSSVKGQFTHAVGRKITNFDSFNSNSEYDINDNPISEGTIFQPHDNWTILNRQRSDYFNDNGNRKNSKDVNNKSAGKEAPKLPPPRKNLAVRNEEAGNTKGSHNSLNSSSTMSSSNFELGFDFSTISSTSLRYEYPIDNIFEDEEDSNVPGFFREVF